MKTIQIAEQHSSFEELEGGLSVSAIMFYEGTVMLYDWRGRWAKVGLKELCSSRETLARLTPEDSFRVESELRRHQNRYAWQNRPRQIHPLH